MKWSSLVYFPKSWCTHNLANDTFNMSWRKMRQNMSLRIRYFWLSHWDLFHSSHTWASRDYEQPDKDLKIFLKESLKYLFQQLYSLFKTFMLSGSAELCERIYCNNFSQKGRVKFCYSYSGKSSNCPIQNSLDWRTRQW